MNPRIWEALVLAASLARTPLSENAVCWSPAWFVMS